MNRYFYTFDSDERFPYQGGYIEIRADSWMEADIAFRKFHPDRPGSCGAINCTGWYSEEEWHETRMATNPDCMLHEIITVEHEEEAWDGPGNFCTEVVSYCRERIDPPF